MNKLPINSWVAYIQINHQYSLMGILKLSFKIGERWVFNPKLMIFCWVVFHLNSCTSLFRCKLRNCLGDMERIFKNHFYLFLYSPPSLPFSLALPLSPSLSPLSSLSLSPSPLHLSHSHLAFIWKVNRSGGSEPPSSGRFHRHCELNIPVKLATSTDPANERGLVAVTLVNQHTAGTGDLLDLLHIWKRSSH